MKYIFIGGCPRSGTTMLGSLLGAHPEALCIPESQFKTDVMRRIVSGQLTVWALNPFLEKHVRFSL
ncbi:hypothetical protein GF366_02510, partial [Candidatus Peregrinibacteria bacterium]|nr:hypothetical protein [Candidatus Peregrinibacteria bacterium]